MTASFVACVVLFAAVMVFACLYCFERSIRLATEGDLREARRDIDNRIRNEQTSNAAYESLFAKYQETLADLSEANGSAEHWEKRHKAAEDRANKLSESLCRRNEAKICLGSSTDAEQRHVDLALEGVLPYGCPIPNQVDELLSEYIDILNEHGFDSVQEDQFNELHRGNEQFPPCEP